MRAKVMILDPAWDYPNNSNDQKTGEFHKYPKITTQDLMALPVPDLLDPSGVLFCWYTGPMAAVAVKVLEAWKMNIVNMFAFVWVKLNPRADAEYDPIRNLWQIQGGFFGYGAGGYTVTNVEAVLVARPKKSRPPIERVDAKQRQLVFAPVGNRSRKPEEVRYRIEKIYGMRERGIVGAEMFATQRVSGWIGLGNEIDGRDIRESLPHLIQCPEIAYEDAEFFPAASLLRGIPESTPQS